MDKLDLSQFDGSTPEPWEWRGYVGQPSLMLHAYPRGWLVVMDFVRAGMRDAAPRFRDANDILHRIDSCPGVDVRDTDKKISCVTHPDMLLVEQAPTLLRELKEARAEIERIEAELHDHDATMGMEIVKLRAENERLKDAIARWSETVRENDKLKAAIEVDWQQEKVRDKELCQTNARFIQARLECGKLKGEIRRLEGTLAAITERVSQRKVNGDTLTVTAIDLELRGLK